MPVSPKENGRGIECVDKLEDEGKEVADVVGCFGDCDTETILVVGNGRAVEGNADGGETCYFHEGWDDANEDALASAR